MLTPYRSEAEGGGIIGVLQKTFTNWVTKWIPRSLHILIGKITMDRTSQMSHLIRSGFFMKTHLRKLVMGRCWRFRQQSHIFNRTLLGVTPCPEYSAKNR